MKTGASVKGIDTINSPMANGVFALFPLLISWSWKVPSCIPLLTIRFGKGRLPIGRLETAMEQFQAVSSVQDVALL
jgi:hypothetical protein